MLDPRLLIHGQRLRTLWLALWLLVQLPVAARADTVEITLLQLNDVYEITPISRGAAGGLARVGALLKELRQRNPNATYAVLAGDFLSPSALGTAVVDGQRLAGRQMVAVLKVMGLDYATFGNHEFDLRKSDFDQRLRELQGMLVSSNVSTAANEPIPGVPRRLLIACRPAGTSRPSNLAFLASRQMSTSATTSAMPIRLRLPAERLMPCAPPGPISSSH